MSNVTGEIKGQLEGESQRLIVSENNRYHQQGIDRNLLRKPDGYVYIFSVSKREFPSSHPLVKTPVKACKSDERYTLVARLADPYQQPDIEQVNGRVVAVANDARRVAQDYCNPANTTLDQDAIIPAKNIFGYGNNLTKQGVFWVEGGRCTFQTVKQIANGKEVVTEVPVPPEEEIAKAEKRRNEYFNFCMEEARVLEISNPATLAQNLTADHHAAAEWCGEETSWHKKRVEAVTCSQCGESKKKNAKFHQVAGVWCIDANQDAWKAAVNSGIKSKADVPEDYRWFKPSKKAELVAE